MARWPWVSRGMHLEVIAAKNEVIHQLQRHVASLEERLKNPAPVNVKVEMPTIQVPSIGPRRKQSTSQPESQQETKLVDWENVNPNDERAIAEIAARELGTGYTAYALSQAVRRIKFNIVQAKREKFKKVLRDAQVGISPETSRIETPAVDDVEIAPAHIMAMIAEAEKV